MKSFDQNWFQTMALGALKPLKLDLKVNNRLQPSLIFWLHEAQHVLQPSLFPQIYASR